MIHFHKWVEIFVGTGWLDIVEVIYECTKCRKWKLVYESMQERLDKLLSDLTRELL